MKSNKNLILIGMMGSGKSTIGRLLGQKLNLRFFDIDFLIEKKTNMKIAEIFEKKGEDEFRNLEKEITLKFLNKTNCIISLGGGAFINKNIRENVLKKTISIWLDADIKILIQRIKNNNKRPLLKKNDKENKLKELYDERKKIYKLAHYRILCDNLNKEILAKKIMKFYANH